jgi:hypothetical protein
MWPTCMLIIGLYHVNQYMYNIHLSNYDCEDVAQNFLNVSKKTII